MRLSREKINHLSKLIVKYFDDEDLIIAGREVNDCRLAIVRYMTEEIRIFDKLEEVAREKLASQKTIREGTTQYEVLFNRYLTEEVEKLAKIRS